MIEKKPILVLVGPTAIGKTEISVNLALELNAEIISADSMQIYKYMDIGTAKISYEETKGVKHYLINEVYPNEEFSVSDFQGRCTKYIELILKSNKLPMIVGGTGLYINSVVYNLDFTNSITNWELRDKYTNLAKKYGNQYIHQILKEVDKASAIRIHKNDTKRIIRALEIYRETGNPMAHYYNNFRQPNDDYDLVMIGLTMDRQKLYDRINKRVDIMIEEGLISEVKRLLDMGYNKELVSMQGLGYKEIVKYIEGLISLDEAQYILKRDTRRFAKRQLTWFRRDDRIKWVNTDNFNNKNEITEYIIKYVKGKFALNRIFKHII